MSGFGNKNDEFEVFLEGYTKRLDDELAKTSPQPTAMTPDQQEKLKGLLDHYKDQLKGIRAEKEDEHDPYSAVSQTGQSALDWDFDNAGHDIRMFLLKISGGTFEGKACDEASKIAEKTESAVDLFRKDFSKIRDELRAEIKPKTLKEINALPYDQKWSKHGALMDEIDMKALQAAADKSLDFLAEQRQSQKELQPERAMTQTQEPSGYNFSVDQPYQVTKERPVSPPPWVQPWMQPGSDGFKKLDGYFTVDVCNELALNFPADDSELMRDDGLVINKGVRIADLAAQSFAQPEPTEQEQDSWAEQVAITYGEETMTETQDLSGDTFSVAQSCQASTEPVPQAPIPPWMLLGWPENQKEVARLEAERRADLTEAQRLAEDRQQQIASDRNPFEGLRLERSKDSPIKEKVKKELAPKKPKKKLHIQQKRKDEGRER